MDEAAAREVLLVRAIEATDTDHALLTHDDRAFATRAAREMTHWQAAERRAPARADAFIAQRARLLLDKLDQRHRRVREAAQAYAWRPWIDGALPVAALLAGLLFERLGDRGHVNVLAFPLLLLLAWNLVVYALLGATWVRSLRPSAPRATRQGLRDGLRRLASRAAPRQTGALAPAIGQFVADWLARTSALTGARLARVVHLSAAAFAAGAIAGLYLRGLVFDYRAGWESTFLDERAVQALLAAVLGPAAQALGQPFPGVAEVAALRFGSAPPVESAARWIHWYALTVAALVLLPRLALAGWAAWRAHRLARAFPLELGAPYFRRLVSDFSPVPVRVRVLPYSYTPDPAAADGLRAAACRLLGESAQLDLRTPVAYGGEAAAIEPLRDDAGATAVALDLALFNLAATPEQENHGALLDGLASVLATPRAVVVDEGPYRRRLGAAAGADARLDERRGAWRAFAASRGWTIAFADLAAPDLAQLERDLGPLLGRAA